jgi:Fe2+ or Zn2+ uptake regulation protein
MTADAIPGSPESAPHSHRGALEPAVAERVAAGLARLQAAGLRRTPARGDVLAVLITAGAHLTVPQVHARLADADRSFDYDYSTVLHALQTLTAHGLAHVLATGGVAAYGIADRPHHHAICTCCDRSPNSMSTSSRPSPRPPNAPPASPWAPTASPCRAAAPAARPSTPRRRSPKTGSTNPRIGVRRRRAHHGPISRAWSAHTPIRGHLALDQTSGGPPVMMISDGHCSFSSDDHAPRRLSPTSPTALKPESGV